MDGVVVHLDGFLDIIFFFFLEGGCCDEPFVLWVVQVVVEVVQAEIPSLRNVF